ncbi:hypothetical protein N9934_01615 [Desulfosarcina sp.]|nr:hypothetical protein [Desulfosarcina sp.]
MSEKTNLLDPHDDYMYLKKKGIIDLQKLFADIKKWYQNHGYEFIESDYKIKTPSPIGTEEEAHMNGWRNEDDFNRWWIYLQINMWDSTPVDVMKDGKVVRMYKCRVKIRFKVQFEFDYENQFEKSKLMLGLRKWYMQNIIKRRVQIEGDKFEYEFHDLHDLIKRDLDMEATGDQYAHYWKN